MLKSRQRRGSDSRAIKNARDRQIDVSLFIHSNTLKIAADIYVHMHIYSQRLSSLDGLHL